MRIIDRDGCPPGGKPPGRSSRRGRLGDQVDEAGFSPIGDAEAVKGGGALQGTDLQSCLGQRGNNFPGQIFQGRAVAPDEIEMAGETMEGVKAGQGGAADQRSPLGVIREELQDTLLQRSETSLTHRCGHPASGKVATPRRRARVPFGNAPMARTPGWWTWAAGPARHRAWPGAAAWRPVRP